MIELDLYPGGKRRIVTFSYDDGGANDVRLAALFNSYGVKATFHINARQILSRSEEERRAYVLPYIGHEIACHTVHHGWPSRMPSVTVVNETLEDRKILEKAFGCPIVGMSYPSGSFDEKSIAAMRACGIVYSRTTRSTGNFSMPDDFMLWHPSCHHKGALPLCERFMHDLDSYWTGQLFYIWGHAHELTSEDDWKFMEQIVSSLAGNEKIWYATNLEIYDYVTAARSLRFSADETMVYNPTSLDVWFSKDHEPHCVKAGETASI